MYTLIIVIFPKRSGGKIYFIIGEEKTFVQNRKRTMYFSQQQQNLGKFPWNHISDLLVIKTFDWVFVAISPYNSPELTYKTYSESQGEHNES